MEESEYLYSDLTREVIGAAMEVHCNLGCGFLESVYEEAMVVELGLRQIPFARQKNLDVYYKKRRIKQFACDLLVGDVLIVELKAIRETGPIEIAQLLNYLKATGKKLGLLFNFGGTSLTYKRLIN